MAGGLSFAGIGRAGAGASNLCSGAGGGTIGTLCSGAGGSGAGSGRAVARFKIWAIWMYALVMLEP